MDYDKIYVQMDKLFEDIETFYEEKGLNNDEDDKVQHAIDEALHFISERYGIIFYKNGFCWDYEKNEQQSFLRR